MVETKDAPLRIDDRISNAVEIAAKIRRMHQQSPLKVVIIDYIQKLPAALPDERSNLRLRIINATDVLHQTCKALDISLVLLAQLGRDSKDENPDINALKESGSLEQDGDTIILLGKTGEEPEDGNAPIEKLVRIAKNRHGPCADLTLNFNPPTTRFY
jgi:replicative DNA helicase